MWRMVPCVVAARDYGSRALGASTECRHARAYAGHSSMKEITRLVAWLCLTLLACSGTEPNEEGDIAAEKNGSIMTGLAPRQASSREFAARCGSAILRRQVRPGALERPSCSRLRR